MIFRSNNVSSTAHFEKIYYNTSFIKVVSEFKYLGLLIDCFINWKPQVKYVASKIAPFIGMLGRTRYVVKKPF